MSFAVKMRLPIIVAGDLNLANIAPDDQPAWVNWLLGRV
jgi:hypothetical protein